MFSLLSGGLRWPILTFAALSKPGEDILGVSMYLGYFQLSYAYIPDQILSRNKLPKSFLYFISMQLLL